MIPFFKPMKLEVDFKDIFESGIYTNAEYCRKLEKKLSEMYKCEALVCSSGTTGLILAIHSLLNRNYIYLPVFNWFSDLYMLKIMNIKVYYADIDPNTWLSFDSNIILHTFGNYNKEIEYNNRIADGTHCLGTKLYSIGLATVISFAPTKLVTAGEGGVILTYDNSDGNLVSYIRELRDRCFRMSEFHAKIGLEYLKHLDEFLSWKKKVFEYYKSRINGTFQEVPYDSNYNTIGFLNLNKLRIPKEIEIKQYYEPLEKGFPNADYVYKNIIVLPSYYNCDYRKIVELIQEANK